MMRKPIGRIWKRSNKTWNGGSFYRLPPLLHPRGGYGIMSAGNWAKAQFSPPLAGQARFPDAVIN